MNLDLGSFFFFIVKPALPVKYNWKLDLLKSL